LLVAFRRPSWTIALRPLEVRWRRRQHLHWTNLMQSLPKTFSAHHAPPLVADLAKVMELYQNDLSDAASIWSS
jgi:hypothetical protein